MIQSQYKPMESIKIMGSAPKASLGPHFEVLVWNVFKCKRNGWHENFSSLLKNKDLVLLQEAVLNSRFDLEFTQSTEHQWMMARSFKNLRNNIETGVKTGAAVAAQDFSFASSFHGEPITNTKKMSLATRYPLHGQQQSLLVVNAHLINFVSLDKFISHLTIVFDAIKQHQGPVLLAGDFNTWNKQRFKHFHELASSLLLQEVNIARRPRLNHLFKHLDHIYYRGLEVSNVVVHTDVRSSDHFPISLSLNIAE
jgi:endonuclease/exonuclease/phosphatase (EEP) superfamily protein YafD